MSRTSKLFHSGAASTVSLITLVAACLLGAGSARAEVPRLTTSTPTIIGGQVIGAGHMSIGASVGYPTARGEFVFGMSRTFDISLQPGLSYGDGWLSGLNQGVGLNLEVPFRFTLATMQKVAIALRVVPYMRLGRAWGGNYYDAYYDGNGSFSWGTGGTLGVRLSIPLPKLFSIVAGLETRAGFGSFHARNCDSRAYDCNDGFFEGATYGVIGLETFIKDKWFFFGEFDIGGAYTSGGAYYTAGRNTCYDPASGTYYGCGGNGHAYFNSHFGFGYLLH